MKKNRLPYHGKTGFQIPENYLADLEERLMSKVISSEIEAAPVEKTKNAFQVPDTYFENLEDRVMNSIQGQQKKEPKVVSLFTREAFYYVAGVAAVLIAIVTNISVQQPVPQSLDNLDMLSLESYLEESVDYSNPEISNFMEDGSFSFATSTPSSYIDQEALMEYLHENIEEPSLIFNEN